MTRFLTASVGILIMVPICIYSGTVVWPLALTFFSLVSVYEMLSCNGMKKEKAVTALSYVYAFLPIVTWLLDDHFSVIENGYLAMFLFTGLYFLSVQISACIVSNRIPSVEVYSTISLVTYVVIGMTCISQIRFLDSGNSEGKYIYLLVFFGAWISDTFAYLTGRLFGKHKLAPSISPKKTVEGSLGAVVSNMIAFALYAFVLRDAFTVNADIVFFAILGALFSVIGQFGDLFASCIKRHYEIKDFGTLFPGHGGALDRFDSTLAIAIVMILLNSVFGTTWLIR